MLFLIGVSVETSAQVVVVYEGLSVSLDCAVTPNSVLLQWKYNNTDVSSLCNITLSPPNLQHTLTIDSVGFDDSGEYTCFVPGNFIAPINQTIVLQVLRGNFQLQSTSTVCNIPCGANDLLGTLSYICLPKLVF